MTSEIFTHCVEGHRQRAIECAAHLRDGITITDGEDTYEKLKFHIDKIRDLALRGVVHRNKRTGVE